MQRRSNVLLALTLVSGVGAAALSGLAGCSSDSTSSSSSGGTPDSGGTSGSSGGDAGQDAAPAAVNACNTFVDRSDTIASRTITWGFPVSTSPERCMTIKKGQEVTFDGDFTIHPLQASGGDSPNPIGTATAGKATFPKAGTFGFMCGVHPSMTGAIKVIE